MATFFAGRDTFTHLGICGDYHWHWPWPCITPVGVPVPPFPVTFYEIVGGWPKEKFASTVKVDGAKAMKTGDTLNTMLAHLPYLAIGPWLRAPVVPMPKPDMTAQVVMGAGIVWCNNVNVEKRPGPCTLSLALTCSNVSMAWSVPTPTGAFMPTNGSVFYPFPLTPDIVAIIFAYANAIVSHYVPEGWSDAAKAAVKGGMAAAESFVTAMVYDGKSFGAALGQAGFDFAQTFAAEYLNSKIGNALKGPLGGPFKDLGKDGAEALGEIGAGIITDELGVSGLVGRILSLPRRATGVDDTPSGESIWSGVFARSDHHGSTLERVVFGTEDANATHGGTYGSVDRGIDSVNPVSWGSGGLLFNRQPAGGSSNPAPGAPANTPPRPNPLSPGDPIRTAPSPPPVRTGVTTVEHLGPGRTTAP